MIEINLEKGWKVFQDIHFLGEKFEVYKQGFQNTDLLCCVSEYENISRLKHLQTIMRDNPFYGRGLRQFNMAPWWYKNQFKVPENPGKYAFLVFDGVDYFAKVWLNGKYLGEHEGYFGRFEFDISDYLNRDPGYENIIHVLVSSPWDKEPDITKVNNKIVKSHPDSDNFVESEGKPRYWAVERHLIKGTYEHDDTFINRDVNPIGICAPVKIFLFDKARISRVNAKPRLENGKGIVEIETIINGDHDSTINFMIVDGQNKEEILNQNGKTGKETIVLDNPHLWKPWDQGKSRYYILRTVIKSGKEILDVNEQHVGFKKAEFYRSSDEISYVLNGKKIFIRGCSYFPDNYISLMSAGRYRRDMSNVRAAGFNAIRVSVHVEQDAFYDICDEMGIIVFQDTDLNWTQERNIEFINRAQKLFIEQNDKLAAHPSIGAWICYNEPDGREEGYFMKVGPVPQIAALARMLSPGIPYIKGSYCLNDPESGDTHNYCGSFDGEDTHYLQSDELIEKFNTEFGFDAPACIESLLRNKELLDRLNPNETDILSIQYYQYRLLKYFIEGYRSRKYNPVSGYFQFMFIDLCPQSFCGVYDYYGVEKEGLKALLESNQPLAVILKEKDGLQAFYAVNDTPISYPSCKAEVWAVDEAYKVLDKYFFDINIPPDSIVRAGQFDTIIKNKEKVAEINLILKNESGEEIASNRYEKPFEHPPHPKGHPNRMSHDLGMRLYHF
jgi:beta-mannosidase